KRSRETPVTARITRFLTATYTSVAVLKGLTFSDWERHPMADEVTRRFARSRTRDRPLSNYPSRRYGVCPECLAADALPYLRKRWTLGWFAVCPKHALVMITGCSRCRSVLILPQLKSSSRHRAELCPSCSASLLDEPTSVAHPLAVALQYSLLNGRD